MRRFITTWCTTHDKENALLLCPGRTRRQATRTMQLVHSGVCGHVRNSHSTCNFNAG